jgi:hypothetical protein
MNIAVANAILAYSPGLARKVRDGLTPLKEAFDQQNKRQPPGRERCLDSRCQSRFVYFAALTTFRITAENATTRRLLN